MKHYDAEKQLKEFEEIFKNDKKNGEYRPPQFKVSDPLSTEFIIKNAIYITTSNDYGSLKLTNELKTKRYPKSNAFSNSHTHNFKDTSLNCTKIRQQNYRAPNTLF